MPNPAPQPPGFPLSDLFLSYSRQDEAFARRLRDRVQAAGRDVWIDVEGIRPSAEWMGEIQEAITSSEAFVFILSPASAASAVCRRELDFASGVNKRVIPVVCR